MVVFATSVATGAWPVTETDVGVVELLLLSISSTDFLQRCLWIYVNIARGKLLSLSL